MYTKEELSKMSPTELRNLGKRMGIKATILFKEEVLIRKILELQDPVLKPEEAVTEEVAETVEVGPVLKPEEAVTEEVATEEVVEHEETVEVGEVGEETVKVEEVCEETVVIDLVKEDRHGKPLEPGYEVAANINGKWYDGVVDGFKVLDGFTYIYVTLTKFGKQKMFLREQVDFKEPGTGIVKTPKVKPVVDVKKLTDLDSADEGDLGGTVKSGKPENPKKTEVKKEEGSKKVSGNTPIEKTKEGYVVGNEVEFEYLGKQVTAKITKMYLHGRTGKERLIFKIDGNIVKKYSQTVTIK